MHEPKVKGVKQTRAQRLWAHVVRTIKDPMLRLYAASGAMIGIAGFYVGFSSFSFVALFYMYCDFVLRSMKLQRLERGAQFRRSLHEDAEEDRRQREQTKSKFKRDLTEKIVQAQLDIIKASTKMSNAKKLEALENTMRILQESTVENDDPENDEYDFGNRPVFNPYRPVDPFEPIKEVD